MKYLAIAAYRCELNGVPNDSLDIQVKYYEASNESEVESILRKEEISSYDGAEGHDVTWPLSEVLAIEPLEEIEHGEELIGFIANLDEINSLAIKPDQNGTDNKEGDLGSP